MKALFGVLLLLNLVFFGYMQWGDKLSGVTSGGLAQGDLNPDKIKLLDMPVVRTAVPRSAVAAVQPVIVVSVPEVSSLHTLAASSPVPTSAPVPVHEATPAVASPKEKRTATICMEWGEFSGADLARASKELAAMQLGDRLTKHTVEYESGYWVYFAPLKNHAAVNKKIAELKALGVDDYFVVHEPEQWVNAISLGVFKTEEAAQNYLVSLHKQGVRTAKVGERKLKLKFTVFALNSLDTKGKNKLIALQNDFPNSELKAVPCQK